MGRINARLILDQILSESKKLNTERYVLSSEYGNTFAQVHIHYKDKKGELSKNPVGGLYLSKRPSGNWEAGQVYVKAAHRRKGLSTAMYDHARTKGNVVPSLALMEDGFNFWKAYDRPALEQNPHHKAQLDYGHLQGTMVDTPLHGKVQITGIGANHVLIENPITGSTKGVLHDEVLPYVK